MAGQQSITIDASGMRMNALEYIPLKHNYAQTIRLALTNHVCIFPTP